MHTWATRMEIDHRSWSYSRC